MVWWLLIFGALIWWAASKVGAAMDVLEEKMPAAFDQPKRKAGFVDALVTGRGPLRRPSC